jgi:hypothetical protein
MINDIASWRIIDECPELPLDMVFPISKRAACLIARNKANRLLKTNFLNIQGAVDMMKGLDYHHDNFMKLIHRLAEVDLSDEAQGLKVYLSHEVVAYLNRLGQFHYLIASDFVKEHCSDATALASTIKKFVVFRMKHSAHRSIDKPRGESARIQETQAMSLSSIGGNTFEPKPANPCNLLEVKTTADMLAYRRNNWIKCYFSQQLITDDPEIAYSFSIEKEHLTIMREAYAVLEKVSKSSVTNG